MRGVGGSSQPAGAAEPRPGQGLTAGLSADEKGKHKSNCHLATFNHVAGQKHLTEAFLS